MQSSLSARLYGRGLIHEVMLWLHCLCLKSSVLWFVGQWDRFVKLLGMVGEVLREILGDGFGRGLV